MNTQFKPGYNFDPNETGKVHTAGIHVVQDGVTQFNGIEVHAQTFKEAVALRDRVMATFNAHDALTDLLRDISGTMQHADPMKERIINALVAAGAA